MFMQVAVEEESRPSLSPTNCKLAAPRRNCKCHTPGVYFKTLVLPDNRFAEEFRTTRVLAHSWRRTLLSLVKGIDQSRLSSSSSIQDRVYLANLSLYFLAKLVKCILKIEGLRTFRRYLQLFSQHFYYFLNKSFFIIFMRSVSCLIEIVKNHLCISRESTIGRRWHTFAEYLY